MIIMISTIYKMQSIWFHKDNNQKKNTIIIKNDRNLKENIKIRITILILIKEAKTIMINKKTIL